MELRHLRYFAGVARYLSYSEASRQLNVAQPAVSQTILDLEEEIGVRLFLRSNRKVQLTAAGTTFLQEVEAILKRTDDAKRAAQRAARGEIGTLKIGFIAPATARILPPVVQTYRERYPDMELQFQHMEADAQLSALYEGALDLGLARPILPEQRPYFEEEMIYSDYLVAVLPGNHPLAGERRIELQKLALEPFVLFRRSSSPAVFDEVVGLCRRAGFSPKIRHEAELMTTAFLLVECGLGVSLAPSCTRGLEEQTTARRPLTVRSNPLCLCAIWPHGSESPTMQAFLNVLREHKPAIRKSVASLCQGEPPKPKRARAARRSKGVRGR
jgi:DNA-binding transcriptional LysR family regulator